MTDKKRFNYKNRWSVYVTFANEQKYFRGGYDEYPEKWDVFIEPFIKVFKIKALKIKKND